VGEHGKRGPCELDREQPVIVYSNDYQ